MLFVNFLFLAGKYRSKSLLSHLTLHEPISQLAVLGSVLTPSPFIFDKIQDNINLFNDKNLLFFELQILHNIITNASCVSCQCSLDLDVVCPFYDLYKVPTYLISKNKNNNVARYY